MGFNDNMKFIGGIRELENKAHYPSIMTLIHKPMKEKQRVVEYMKYADVVAVSPSVVSDVLNPSIRLPELCLMGDGVYKWRSDLVYYVETYDLELPEEFVAHVLSQPPNPKIQKLRRRYGLDEK